MGLAMRNSASTGRGGNVSLGMRMSGAAALAAVLVAMPGAVQAQQGMGQPSPGALGFQESASPIMDFIHWFHNGFLLPIITVICIFVAGLLAYCIYRFSEKRNPVPSKTTHHVGLEVAWTVIPVLILIVIAIPSFRLLYQQQVIPRADMTIKATGSSWRWTYDYPDHGNFSFVSNMQTDDERRQRIQAGAPAREVPRLLAVDNEVVVPVNKTIRVQVTSSDVMHAFAVPGFGIKVDAVPGRLNETWFRATREGIFYGQCSELCGKDHAFMPIAVRVVSEQAFAAWVEDAKKKFADTGRSTTVAANEIATAR
ncbi:cytochrome c oxidase subunit 2 [Phreatobacter oligotrophus]|jgi:cytochrome c oxidase subunit 2|uniref:Cytochrome c oxidase subunit 2 n=2 Tax=Phreatobacter oligotrophus TaxID=1122261 RepID=A0A2T4ZGW5_9HYPH|nr:cytochrome c oxidase subunit 2 [Phreatobacter oligotrophus]